MSLKFKGKVPAGVAAVSRKIWPEEILASSTSPFAGSVPNATMFACPVMRLLETSEAFVTVNAQTLPET